MERKEMRVCDKEIRVSRGLVRIARLDADMYHFLTDPEATITALSECGTRVDLFTFTQTIVDTKPKYSYPMEWENLAVLPVSTFEEWWDKQIGFKARNKAKQAEKKGVVLREVPFGEDLVRGIWEIYNETPIRQGRPYPHFGKSMEAVYRESATYLEHSTFIGAYAGEELIGFIRMVADEAGVQAGLMNIVSKICHRDKAQTNALVTHAVRAAANRGIRNLVYSHFAYGKRDRDNLTEFKERNGFARVDLPRYYVPITAWGRLALTLGLHHRFVDRLPEDMGEKLRDLRSKWYNRSHQSAKAST
jgi:hypothetical protein